MEARGQWCGSAHSRTHTRTGLGDLCLYTEPPSPASGTNTLSSRPSGVLAGLPGLARRWFSHADVGYWRQVSCHEGVPEEAGREQQGLAVTSANVQAQALPPSSCVTVGRSPPPWHTASRPVAAQCPAARQGSTWTALPPGFTVPRQAQVRCLLVRRPLLGPHHVCYPCFVALAASSIGFKFLKKRDRIFATTVSPAPGVTSLSLSEEGMIGRPAQQPGL